MTTLVSASLKFWESVGLWGFVFVIVGVAGEGVEICIKLFWRKLYKRKMFCLDVIGAAFWIVLVIGLAVEFFGNVKAMRIADSINSQLDAEAGKARKDAGDAKVLAAQIGITNALLWQTNLQEESSIELLRSNNTVLATQLIETSNNVVKANPLNQPIATISAMVWLVTAGTDRTGYTNLNNLKINQTCVDLNENGGYPNNIQLSFGRHDQIKNGWPVLCLAASWTQLGTTATGEGCRFWHLEFREVAQRPPSQRELVREAANWDAYDLEARFLPPNSIVLNGGNLTLTINSITQPTIPIPAQYAIRHSAHQDFLNNPPTGVTVFCQ